MDQKSTFVDFYEVLGVWPTADDKAIKKAYFDLAKLHHPDVVTETTTNATGVDFKMINEAFAVLSDPMKRRKFDEQLKKKTGGSTEERNESDKRSAQLAFDQARQAMKASHTASSSAKLGQRRRTTASAASATRALSRSSKYSDGVVAGAPSPRSR